MLIRPIDVSDHTAVLELLTLQIKSYEVEAKLIGFCEIPPLTDSIQTIQKSKETFIGCYEDGALIGAAAYDVSAEQAAITRMMVHPEHFRRGVATGLLEEIERRIPPGMPIEVSTGTRNVPAMELYMKHGYVPEGEVLIARGITVTMLTKERGARRQADERP
ncbi:GNAT family N-acetyltransferase [Paenibacillus hamazuiensis]|uniref:GNAT family N-acetyltransferase n=1 Tax=Paenibacillus hamazuiensis TaxID=2936508 RepID=UPI00200F63F9|nr:GNAT family N-acetyltransferase [Paenibacillus hamazuiensis]